MILNGERDAHSDLQDVLRNHTPNLVDGPSKKGSNQFRGLDT